MQGDVLTFAFYFVFLLHFTRHCPLAKAKLCLYRGPSPSFLSMRWPQTERQAAKGPLSFTSKSKQEEAWLLLFLSLFCPMFAIVTAKQDFSRLRGRPPAFNCDHMFRSFFGPDLESKYATFYSFAGTNTPLSGFGKFIGGICALFGVFTITLPVPIVVNSFSNFFKTRLWRSEVAIKRRERLIHSPSGQNAGKDSAHIELNGVQ